MKKKYKVIADFTASDDTTYTIGQEVEMPENEGSVFVEQGLVMDSFTGDVVLPSEGKADEISLPIEEIKVEEVPQPKNDDGTEIPTPPSPTSEDLNKSEGIVPEAVTPLKKYMGKEIISESIQTINGKEYNSIRLSDGSTQLLSPEEYKELTA